MKHYLDLVPISAKIHKKQSRMSIFCIVLAVFLVTTIFGMADMFIRSQILQGDYNGYILSWGVLCCHLLFVAELRKLVHRESPRDIPANSF